MLLKQYYLGCLAHDSYLIADTATGTAVVVDPQRDIDHYLQRDARQPHAVLTGDTLFIGDVGRPDLMASVGMTATELAGKLYDSLHQKLLTLPDETLMYPAHGAGSMCGRNLSSDTVSPLGAQRQLNYALQPMRKEAFVALVTADQPEAPAYFAYDAMLNRRERPTLSQTLQRVLRPLGLDEVVRRLHAGAQVLDVRQPADFARQHLAGSVNISLGGAYATWAGTVLDQQQPIVLVAEPGQEEEAAMRLGRIGFDHIAGYLDGGPQTLAARPELTRCTERVTPAELAARLTASISPLVLDVRTEYERHDKHLAGSLHIPLNRLPKRLDDLPRDRKVVIHCASGYRASIAASLLERHGLTDLADLVGGIAAWEAAGLEMVTPTLRRPS